MRDERNRKRTEDKLAGSASHPALHRLRPPLRPKSRESLQPRVSGETRGAGQATESKGIMTDAYADAYHSKGKQDGDPLLERMPEDGTWGPSA